MRTRCLAAVIVGTLSALTATAHADPRAEIAAKARAAMASYDSLDYDAARKLLNQALAIAKRAHLEHDPVVARVYVDLGIAQLAGSDQEAARASLAQAVQIDPKIGIDPGYKTPELARMLDEAKSQAGGGMVGDGGGNQADADIGADCRGVHGLLHNPVETGRTNVAVPIEALVGYELTPARVVVMYRPEGAIDFKEVKLIKQVGCKYAGSIPGSGMQGNLVHYYVVAYDANNKALAAKGTSGQPNVIRIGGGGGGGGPIISPGNSVNAGTRDDNPLVSPGNGAGTGSTVGDGVGVSSRPPERQLPSSSSVELSVSIGTGFAYVTGQTEAGNKVQNAGLGNSLFVVTPELAYAFSRQFAIGVAFRLGFPIGADIDGHSTSAPAGFLRMHYHFASDGDGFGIMGEAGIGVLRNTLTIDAMDMPGMDTDVVAQGPLLLGLGLGYRKHLGSVVSFVAELDTLAGIALVDKLGSAINLNSGIGGDFSVGLTFGF